MWTFAIRVTPKPTELIQQRVYNIQSPPLAGFSAVDMSLNADKE
jgi:hypothetical protein